MRRVRSTDTSPERRLRSELHRRGVRFRLGQQVAIDGGRAIRPDLAFRRSKVAVFVDGCFWHRCPAHCRMPSSNRDYWVAKIDRNAARDELTTTRLEAVGWTVVRIWEHDDLGEAAEQIADVLARARATRERSAAPAPAPSRSPAAGGS